MSSIIQNKFHEILGDAARLSKFTFCLPPVTGSADIIDHLVYSVKSLTLPTVEHTHIDFKHKGRPIPIRGTTKFSQQFTVTFYLNEAHSNKRFFEDWIIMMEQRHYYYNPRHANQQHREMHGLPQGGNPPPFMTWYNVTTWIEQWDFDGMKPMAMYEIFNVFPIKVDAPTYSYDAVGQIGEFTVTFAYSHYKLHSKKMHVGDSMQNQLYHTTNRWALMGSAEHRGNPGTPYIRQKDEFQWDEDIFITAGNFKNLEQTADQRQEIYWRPYELARWDNQWNRYRETVQGANTKYGGPWVKYDHDEVENRKGTLDEVLRKKYAVLDRDYEVIP